MSGIRFVRFYPSDWRSGCIGLTPEEEGIYVRVCAHAWETGVRLPIDDREAAARLLIDVRMWKRLKASLIKKGKLHVGEDGIFNARAEREFAAAQGTTGKEKTAETYMDSARRFNDRQQANGRDQVEGWDASAHSINDTSDRLQDDFDAKSSRSLPEVSDIFAKKGNEINGHLKSHIKEPKKETPQPPKGGPSPQDALTAFEAYNATALRCGLQQAAKLTPDRQRKIIARLKDYGLDGWSQALANIERSSFLTGRNDREWRASLDFLLQAASFAKVHDGTYGNGRHTSVAANVNWQPDPRRKRRQSETEDEYAFRLGVMDGYLTPDGEIIDQASTNN